MNGTKADARLRSRAKCRSDLEEHETEISRPPKDEVPTTTDSRYKHYKANEDSIIFKEGLLFRKCFGETGSIKYYQILIPK